MANDTYHALIEGLTRQRASELGIDNQDAAFMSVAHELILLPFDLSVDEIAAGLTDGGGDGQIDAVYVIINGTPVTPEDEDAIPDKGPLDIDLVFIQSKNTRGFEENPLKIIRTTVADLLDLSKGRSGPVVGYSERIQEYFSLARDALFASAGRSGRVNVLVAYASKGSTESIHPSVSATTKTLIGDISSAAGTPNVRVEMFGASELISLSRQPRTRTRRLENFEVISSAAADSFACLTTLGAFVSFLSDDDGVLIRGLFDANVRDFLGKAEVNEEIKRTLQELDEGDFWWLNNGITIVASDIDQKGKVLTLTDPLLVNGLQTSNVIFGFMSDALVDSALKARRKSQLLLVKIIQPSSEKARDGIIKATNSQTHIPKAYLRGMDHVHRNIEDHLKSSGLFYERRKNQYRNAGKKPTEIVTLQEMAQSLMAALLFRPADARGRPTSLLKSDDDYLTLFSEKYPLDTFSHVIFAKRRIMSGLISFDPSSSSSFKNDVVFHILAYLSAKKYVASQQAAHLWKDYTPSQHDIDEAIKAVADLFQTAGGTDRIAKSPDFQQIVLDAARAADVIGDDGNTPKMSVPAENYDLLQPPATLD